MYCTSCSFHNRILLFLYPFLCFLILAVIHKFSLIFVRTNHMVICCTVLCLIAILYTCLLCNSTNHHGTRVNATTLKSIFILFHQTYFALARYLTLVSIVNTTLAEVSFATSVRVRYFILRVIW